MIARWISAVPALKSLFDSIDRTSPAAALNRVVGELGVFRIPVFLSLLVGINGAIIHYAGKGFHPAIWVSALIFGLVPPVYVGWRLFRQSRTGFAQLLEEFQAPRPASSRPAPPRAQPAVSVARSVSPVPEPRTALPPQEECPARSGGLTDLAAEPGPADLSATACVMDEEPESVQEESADLSAEAATPDAPALSAAVAEEALADPSADDPAASWADLQEEHEVEAEEEEEESEAPAAARAAPSAESPVRMDSGFSADQTLFAPALQAEEEDEAMPLPASSADADDSDVPDPRESFKTIQSDDLSEQTLLASAIPADLEESPGEPAQALAADEEFTLETLETAEADEPVAAARDDAFFVSPDASPPAAGNASLMMDVDDDAAGLNADALIFEADDEDNWASRNAEVQDAEATLTPEQELAGMLQAGREILEIEPPQEENPDPEKVKEWYVLWKDIYQGWFDETRSRLADLYSPRVADQFRRCPTAGIGDRPSVNPMHRTLQSHLCGCLKKLEEMLEEARARADQT